MKAVLIAAILSSFCLAICFGDYSDMEKCIYQSDDGKSFDFHTIIKGGEGYSWTQQLWSTNDDIYINTDFSTQSTFQLQFEICRNVSKPIHPTICKRPFPMYLATLDSQGQVKCNGLGDVRVGKFYRTPSMQGVYLSYYGGESPAGQPDPVRYSVRIYILCDKTTDASVPVLEHIKESYQVHVHMYSKYACS